MATVRDSFDYLFNGVFKALKGSQPFGSNNFKVDQFRQGSLVTRRAVVLAMGFEPSFPMRLGITFRETGADGQGRSPVFQLAASQRLCTGDNPRLVF